LIRLQDLEDAVAWERFGLGAQTFAYGVEALAESSSGDPLDYTGGVTIEYGDYGEVLRITDFVIDEQGRSHVQYPSDPGYYYILFHPRSMIHILHSISRVALLCLSVCQATAAINTITSFNSSQTDLVSTDPFDFLTAANSDADQVPGDAWAQAQGIVKSRWQDHELKTIASTRKSASGSKAVSMMADFVHEFDMRGVLELGWRASHSQLDASITFNDVVSLVAVDPALPNLLSVTYFIELTAYRTHSIDIPAGQRPLYRLEDRIRFNANAGGLEFAPVEFDMTFYDIHTRPPITTEYSVLEDDVNIPDQQLIPDSQQIHILEFDLPRVLESGNIVGYAADFTASLVIESTHKFLNDGPEVNYFLRGQVEFNFSNSADVLGMLVRDETGAIRTDIEVTSAEGVIYPLLTAPITNAPPPTPTGPVILSPVAVSESGLGTSSAVAGLENIINRSGLGKPMVSGSTLFDDYIFDGDRPTADPDYRGYWSSEVSYDGTYNGALDFDLGDVYVVDRLAIWNGTLEDIELLIAPSPVGPWQSAGTFTLPNQNPLVYSLIEPEVLVLDESIHSRYLRVQVNSTYPYLPRETFEYAILRELALSVSPLPEPEGAILSLRVDPGSLFVTWPSSAIGFQLQSATTLADGGDWRDIDEPPALQGDQYGVSVDRESAGTRFFRLHKP